MIELKLLETTEEIMQVSSLNALNLKTTLSQEEKDSQGFLSWTYDVELLKGMNQINPSIIAKKGDEVVGYALMASVEARSFHKELDLLLEKIEGFNYRGKKLSEYSFYMIGQLCVAKAYRGFGLTDRMYAFHEQQYSEKFDLMATTVVLENVRSIRVHERAGFETISEIEDHFGNWRVIVKPFLSRPCWG